MGKTGGGADGTGESKCKSGTNCNVKWVSPNLKARDTESRVISL